MFRHQDNTNSTSNRNFINFFCDNNVFHLVDPYTYYTSTEFVRETNSIIIKKARKCWPDAAETVQLLNHYPLQRINKTV